MDGDGENARRVVEGDSLAYIGSVAWSRTGSRIAFQKFRMVNGTAMDYTIETRGVDGKWPSTVFEKLHYSGPSIDHNFPEDFCWLSDGRIVYAVREAPPKIRDSNLWSVAVDEATGMRRTQPARITRLAGFHMESISASADASKLLFESSIDQSYVYVGRLQAKGKLFEGRRLTPDEE
jgi:hypothetical protein